MQKNTGISRVFLFSFLQASYKCQNRIGQDAVVILFPVLNF